MSDIYVVIRNQDNIAMTSIAGEPFRVSIRRDGLIYDEQSVGLRFADAHFYNFPLGRCVIVVEHPLVNPNTLEQEVILRSDEALRVRLIYLEPERQFLRVEIIPERLDT